MQLLQLSSALTKISEILNGQGYRLSTVLVKAVGFFSGRESRELLDLFYSHGGCCG